MTDASGQDLSTARAFRLHASATAMLYDIQRRVRSGYVWWLVGEIPAPKILAVIAKLDRQYDLSASRFARSRRKAAGDASTVLFVWPVRNDPEGYTTRFRFLLLATAHLEGEVMYDGRRKPVRVDLYANSNAVFHLQPTSKTSAKQERTFSYTWQLSPKSLDLMRARLTEAARTDVLALLKLLRAYRQLPLTSGYRLQFKQILSEVQPIWSRNTLPTAQALRQQIKAGARPNPFTEPLPFVAGFPKLFDDPPMTLTKYLEASQKRRKHIEKQRAASVAADHTQEAP